MRPSTAAGFRCLHGPLGHTPAGLGSFALSPFLKVRSKGSQNFEIKATRNQLPIRPCSLTARCSLLVISPDSCQPHCQRAAEPLLLRPLTHPICFQNDADVLRAQYLRPDRGCKRLSHALHWHQWMHFWKWPSRLQARFLSSISELVLLMAPSACSMARKCMSLCAG